MLRGKGKTLEENTANTLFKLMRALEIIKRSYIHGIFLVDFNSKISVYKNMKVYLY